MMDLSMLDRQYPMTEFTPEEYKVFRRNFVIIA